MNYFPKLFTLLLLTLVSLEYSYALKCGLSHAAAASNSRIAGGVPVRAHQYPWAVYLETRHVPVEIPATGGYSYYMTTCAGTLIDNQWVITAAHCLPTTSPYPGYRINATLVQLGAHNVTNKDEARLVVNALRIYRHERFNESIGFSSNQNIALIKLPTPLNFEPISDKIAPICLPIEGDSISRTECQALGWGRATVDDTKNSDILRVANASITSRDICRQGWGERIDDFKMCAGDNVQSACSGDGGGPLQCRNEDGQWTLEGINAFSEGKCDSAVYEKVASYLHWINRIRQDDV